MRDQALVVHNSLFEPCSSYLSLLTRQDAFASSATALHLTEPVFLTWESWCSAVAWALYVHKIGESYTKMIVSHSKPEMAMRLFFICAYMRLRFMRIDMRISAWNRIQKSAYCMRICGYPHICRKTAYAHMKCQFKSLKPLHWLNNFENGNCTNCECLFMLSDDLIPHNQLWNTNA